MKNLLEGQSFLGKRGALHKAGPVVGILLNSVYDTNGCVNILTLYFSGTLVTIIKTLFTCINCS